MRRPAVWFGVWRSQLVWQPRRVQGPLWDTWHLLIRVNGAERFHVRLTGDRAMRLLDSIRRLEIARRLRRQTAFDHPAALVGQHLARARLQGVEGGVDDALRGDFGDVQSAG